MSFYGSTYKLRSKLPSNKSSTLANLLRTADFASDLTVEIQDYMRGFSLTRVGCQKSLPTFYHNGVEGSTEVTSTYSTLPYVTRR